MSEPHRIGGRYEVGELLGRGGMAEVRKGTDVRLGRTVAIKRLRTDLASDTTFQARFRREAQSAASLNHPAIVSVYDTGEEMSTDGSNVAQPYIVMEYVAGRTLRDIIREGRKILPERALEITSGVLAALDYSHRAGIIHRDIKPGNVMLTPSGDVKVMDFGIARAVSDASNTMTQTAAVVGTAQYLSPEQARGETVDSRSDVYSTGCQLYELLTGRPPFVGDSPVSVAYQHVREQAPPPSSLDEDLTPELDAIVMKSLAKNVGDRYASAAAMKADIDRYLAGQPVQAPAVATKPRDRLDPRRHATQISRHGGGGRRGAGAQAPRSAHPAVLLLLALIAAALVFGPKLFESAPEQQSVPTVTGLTRAQAERTIRDSGLEVGEVTTAASREVAEGRVISQQPQAGDLVDPNARSTSWSRGQAAGPAARRRGEEQGRRRRPAAQRGTERGAHRARRGRPEGPGRGDAAPGRDRGHRGLEGDAVLVDGPEEVPSVIGKSEAEATELIRDAGFKVSRVTDSSTKAKKGTVLQQSPNAGQTLDKGSTVTIVVSTYEEPEPSPEPSPSPSPSVPRRRGPGPQSRSTPLLCSAVA